MSFHPATPLLQPSRGGVSAASADRHAGAARGRRPVDGAVGAGGGAGARVRGGLPAAAAVAQPAAARQAAAARRKGRVRSAYSARAAAPNRSGERRCHPRSGACAAGVARHRLQLPHAPRPQDRAAGARQGGGGALHLARPCSTTARLECSCWPSGPLHVRTCRARSAAPGLETCWRCWARRAPARRCEASEAQSITDAASRKQRCMQRSPYHKACSSWPWPWPPVHTQS